MKNNLNTVARPILILVMALGLACSGGGDDAVPTGPTSSPAPAPQPAAAGEPTDDDWARLGAQLASMGVEALRQALPSQGTPSVASRSPWGVLDVRMDLPIGGLSFSRDYFCCGSFGMSYTSIQGQIRVRTDSSGRVTVVETGSTYVSHHGPSRDGTSKWTIEIPTDGLQITSNLVTLNGKVEPVQQFRLAGRLTYFIEQGQTKTATIDIVLGYQDFYLDTPRLQPRTATGQLGSLRLANASLPAVETFPRCPCPGGPEPGAPPNPGCSIMCTP
jgi:hypothetical protein